MELNQAMQTRQSIRTYENTPVSDETLQQLLQAMQLAPSWKNSQTARYYVVRTPETVAQVKAQCLPPFNQKNAAAAPVLVVSTFVTGKSGFMPDGTAANEIGDGWGAYDLGWHDAYLLLQATQLGLSSLIMGIRDSDALRRLLGIPAEEQVMAVIALGHAAAAPQRPARLPLQDVAKFF